MSQFHLMLHQECRQSAMHERDIATAYEARARMGLGDEIQQLEQAQVHRDRALYFMPTEGQA